MKRDQFLAQLRQRFPDLKFQMGPLNRDSLIMPPHGVPEVLEHLRDAEETKMQVLEFLTCTDHAPWHLSLIYYLYSYEYGHRLALKVNLPRDNAAIRSVTHLWQNADWNEREVYDLFGVFFAGHPDLRRIMMPEDWEGHPLRKDYCHPNLALKPD